VQIMKEIIDKLNPIKIFCSKKLSRKWEQQTERKYLQKIYLISLLPKIHKNTLVNNKKTKNPTKKWTKDYLANNIHRW
jgi:hypothetical protein